MFMGNVGAKDEKNTEEENGTSDFGQCKFIKITDPSINSIRNNIKKFLQTKAGSAIAIRGEWGTGKTRFWHEYFHEITQNNNIHFGKYSYVSLFGMNSINDLKRGIYANITKVESEKMNCRNRDKKTKGQSVDVNNFIEDNPQFIKLGQYLKLVKLPFIRIPDGLIESCLHSTIRDTIICLDDFERKGKDLDTKMILGVMNDLVEQKNCKLILILNDDALNKKMKKEYDEYREKIIDKELNFKPLQSDCFDIAKNISDSLMEPNEKDCLIKSGISNCIKNTLEKLNINNIRTIVKIIRCSNELYTKINSVRKIEDRIDLFEKYEVFEDIVKIICICSSVYYEKISGAPSIRFLENNLTDIYCEQSSNQIKIKTLGLGFVESENMKLGIPSPAKEIDKSLEQIEREKGNIEREKYMLFLNSHEFPIDRLGIKHREIITRLVIETILNGYIKEDNLLEIICKITTKLHELDRIEGRQIKLERYEAAIMRMHSSFDGGEVGDQILNEIFESTKDAIYVVDTLSAAQSISILRCCDREEQAESLICLYIQNNIEEISSWTSARANYNKNYRSIRPHDRRFLNAVFAEWEKNHKTDSSTVDLFHVILEMGRYLTHGGSMLNSLEEIMHDASEEDYYKEIKNYRSEKYAAGQGYFDEQADEFYSAVHMIARNGHELKKDFDDPQFKIISAIKKLGKESPLNAIRVQKFIRPEDL